MVLVDTSIWIRFLAGREPFATELGRALEREEVLAHDLVYGELLIGARGTGRVTLLGSYNKLPRVAVIPHQDVVELVGVRKLQGRGIGWVDAHLIASAVVARVRLWTADARLAEIATEVGYG